MKKQNILIAAFLIIAVAATAHYYQIDKLVMVQSAITQQDAKWTAGITSVSHLSTEEKLAMSGTRYAPPPADAIIVSRPTLYSVAAPADPPTFDWRNVNGIDWMTSVKYQRDCGSCWAFSTVGVVEAAFNIYSDNPNLDFDLSEQHLVSSCCSAGDCGGGWPDWALDYIGTTGMSNETCFPCIRSDSACTPCSGWAGSKYQIVDNVYIPATKSDYKWALQEYGPLAVCLNHPEDWFFYMGGVYEPVWTSEGFGWADHSVVLVGWDDSLNAWICKNSYGSGWGTDGYGYVDYDVLLQYDYAYGVSGVVPHDADGDMDPNPPPYIITEWAGATITSIYEGEPVNVTCTWDYGPAADHGWIRFTHWNPHSEINEEVSVSTPTGSHTFSVVTPLVSAETTNAKYMCVLVLPNKVVLTNSYGAEYTILDEPTPPAQINDRTDTLTFDKSTYQLGDTVYMYATGMNIGGETWSGKVTFAIIQPNGVVYEEIEQHDISVTGGSSETVSDNFQLPSTGQSGTWTIQSRWIKDDGTIDARSTIQL